MGAGFVCRVAVNICTLNIEHGIALSPALSQKHRFVAIVIYRALGVNPVGRLTRLFGTTTVAGHAMIDASSRHGISNQGPHSHPSPSRRLFSAARAAMSSKGLGDHQCRRFKERLVHSHVESKLELCPWSTASEWWVVLRSPNECVPSFQLSAAIVVISLRNQAFYAVAQDAKWAPNGHQMDTVDKAGYFDSTRKIHKLQLQ